ncbi:M48 family metalloprotease [Kitasatospora sp. HPMI-4]|uniref:M48 family metalloprotease n=1 Tax=Kitasatospora sp. HPMI-4 TaxID=3448443 RepID=UPI003F1B66E7
MARPAEGPFSAPSSTTLRFASLVLLAAAVTATWWGTLVDLWHPTDGLPEARCEVYSGYYTQMGPSAWLSPQDEVKYQHYQHCAAGVALPNILSVAGVLGVLALVTLLLFALHPWWHGRRRRLVPIEELPSPDSTALREELRELVGLAGLSRAPRFLLDPANLRPAGQAFGGLGRRRVSLSVGLVAQRRHAPEKFRAVVAHELAHVRNGDVTVTYLTLAVWRAFVLVTVLPVLAALADPLLETTQPLRNPLRGSRHLLLSQFIELGWFFLVLIALGYVLRVSVLRAREGYADARAAQWTGPAALRGVFAVSAERDGTRWWHTHPRLLTRVRLLERPEGLLRPGFWETFTAAFVVQIAGDYARQAKDNWNAPTGSFAYQGTYDAATALTALVVVVVAWRGAAFIRSGAGGRGVYTRAGLGLGLGLASAYGLSALRMYGVLRNGPGSEGSFTAAGLGQDLIIVTLMLTAVLVLCHWAGHCWQLVATASRRRRVLAAAVMLLVGWACLRWWNDYNYELPPLGPTLSADTTVWRHFVSQAHGTGLDLAVVEAVLAPFILAALIGRVTVFAAPLLWLLPLLVGAARREAIRSAARIGAIAASMWLVLDIGLRILAHLTAPPAVRATGGYAVVFLCWEIAAVLAVQAGAAVLLGSRRTRMMPALFATTLTSLLCCLLLWGEHRTDACLPGLGLSAGGCPGPGDVFVAFEALRAVGILGFVLTMAGVLLGRRLRRRPKPRPAAVGLPGTAARLGLVAVAGMFVAVAVWPTLHLWPDARHPRVDLVGTALGLAPATHYSPEEIGKVSYRDWLQGGGQSQLAGSHTAFFRYAQQLEPSLLKQLQPSLVKQNLDWLAIARDPQLRKSCQDLATAVGQARAFPAPPWDTASASWSSYLQQLAASADNCTAAATAADSQAAQADLYASWVSTTQQVNALLEDETAAMNPLR